jgi:hypothetical protein
MEATEKWRVLSEMWKDDAKKSRENMEKWKNEFEKRITKLEENLDDVASDTPPPPPRVLDETINTTAITATTAEKKENRIIVSPLPLLLALPLLFNYFKVLYSRLFSFRR